MDPAIPVLASPRFKDLESLKDYVRAEIDSLGEDLRDSSRRELKYMQAYEAAHGELLTTKEALRICAREVFDRRAAADVLQADAEAARADAVAALADAVAARADAEAARADVEAARAGAETARADADAARADADAARAETAKTLEERPRKRARLAADETFDHVSVSGGRLVYLKADAEHAVTPLSLRVVERYRNGRGTYAVYHVLRAGGYCETYRSMVAVKRALGAA